ncbi:MAG: hypothetical protein ACOCU1_00940 [Bacillota bacterium]
MAKRSKRQKDQLSSRTLNDEQTVFDRTDISIEERRASNELRTMLTNDFSRMTAINDTLNPFVTIDHDIHK